MDARRVGGIVSMPRRAVPFSHCEPPLIDHHRRKDSRRGRGSLQFVLPSRLKSVNCRSPYPSTVWQAPALLRSSR